MWRKPNEGKPSEPSPSVGGSQPYSAPTPVKAEEPVSSPPPVAAPAASISAAPSMSSMILNPPPSSSNVSKINAGLKIQGEVSGDTDLFIDGEIQGKIRMTSSRVTVGPNGKVQAEIEAREISVEGTVQGNLKASHSAQLGPSSNVVGSIISPRVGIADGAKLRGKIETVRASQSPKPPAAQTPAKEDQHETIGAKVE